MRVSITILFIGSCRTSRFLVSWIWRILSLKLTWSHRSCSRFFRRSRTLPELSGRLGRRARQCSPAAAGENLEVGRQVAVRLNNGGRADLDVTLLFLDSGFGILPIFPRDGVSNRVGFDDPEPVFLPLGPLSDDSLGREYILVLALPGLPDRPPVSFAWLAQAALPRNRAVSAASPLHRLLSRAAFAEGGTRGAVSTGSGQTPALHLIGWQTVQKETKEPGNERE